MKFRPIFIVGVGRSGTSLLQSMLNAHSKIAFPPETHFVRSHLAKGLSLSECKNQILKDQYLQNLELDLEKIVAKSESCEAFYKQMMAEYLANKAKDFIGDKDPKNIENLKVIKKYFPDALVVHVYRDPRAVISSRLKAKWSKDNPLWQHILAYKAQFNYMKQNQYIFGDNFVDLKYEELLENPKAELEKILVKFDLKFEIGMLEFFKSAGDVVKGEEISWKENLYKPIMKENIDKWKNEMNEKTTTIIEKSLLTEMKRCRYEYDSKSMILSTIFSILSKIYCIKNCN